MKKHSILNPCTLYLLIVLACLMNDRLYSGGGTLAKGFQGLQILVSMGYTVYAMLRYKLPAYMKGLFMFVAILSLYGFFLLASGEVMTIQATGDEIPPTNFLKYIFLSLLPIFPFYVFAKQGYLTERVMRRWFIVFFILAVSSFFSTKEMLALATGDDEHTNNAGYSFVALLPAIVLFRRKPLLQYMLLLLCCVFVLASMKRGALLIAGLCSAWFVVKSIKGVSMKHKKVIIICSLLCLLAGIGYVIYLMKSSDLFMVRIAQTKAGETSSRDELYGLFLNYFLHESSLTQFLFGNGANATLLIGKNYAHNDWLEIAIGQGVLGLLAYLFYWIGFVKDWRRLKKRPNEYLMLGMLVIMYFMQTLFSMSYISITKYSAMMIGYCIAKIHTGRRVKMLKSKDAVSEPEIETSAV